MTPEQIQNWRDYLALSLDRGLVNKMPVQIIEAVRDRLQAAANVLASEKPKPVIKNGRCQHGVSPTHCKVCN